MGSLDRAVIHYTAGAGDYNTVSRAESAANVRAVQNLHMDVNGWSDVGYHFLVDKLGNAFEGRAGAINGLPRGAHDTVNANSFAFNVMGYFHPPYNQQPTSPMMEMLYDLIAWRMPDSFRAYGSSVYGGKTTGFIAGHRNVVATSCPGNEIYQLLGNDDSGGPIRTAVHNRIVGQVSGIVVDNDSPSYLELGEWFTSANNGFYGNSSRWSYTGVGNKQALFRPRLDSGGTYDVYAWWVAGSNRAPDTEILIVHDSGTTSVLVDQRQNGSKWNYLGSFPFAPGTAGRVIVTNNGAPNAVVSADAVRWARRAPWSVVVDNSDPGFTASATWPSSTTVAGYYGANYRYRATEPVSDPATWTATLPETGRYRVEVRWTPGTTRASAAPYFVYHRGGTTQVNADQRQSGSAWALLGTFEFAAGTLPRVALSCWTLSGDYVIADAVRFVRA